MDGYSLVWTDTGCHLWRKSWKIQVMLSIASNGMVQAGILLKRNAAKKLNIKKMECLIVKYLLYLAL